MIEDVTNLTKTGALIDTSYAVLASFSKLSLILVSLGGVISVIAGVRYRNYVKMKERHIGMLKKNILDKWKNITCEMPRTYALNSDFISLLGFKSIQNHRDFNYAIEHMKSYTCFEVWERTMKLISSINKSANEVLIEIDKTINYRLNRRVFTSGIYISPSQVVLNSVVQALMADVKKGQGCNGSIRIEEREKWVQTDLGVILAEGGSTQDLVVFKGIICDIISSKYYKEKIRMLHFQFKTVKREIGYFKTQLSQISTLVEHTKELKGKCKACPHILWAFRS